MVDVGIQPRKCAAGWVRRTASSTASKAVKKPAMADRKDDAPLHEEGGRRRQAHDVVMIYVFALCVDDISFSNRSTVSQCGAPTCKINYTSVAFAVHPGARHAPGAASIVSDARHRCRLQSLDERRVRLGGLPSPRARNRRLITLMSRPPCVFA